MRIASSLSRLLAQNSVSPGPVLLALSGGPDSLCLFYYLLRERTLSGTEFHAAHVDHRWRPESGEEAEILKNLAAEYDIPFHLKRLDPALLQGNLESACREERYSFFASLNREYGYKAVLTGHHADDLAETVFKRICEGAHWSRWNAIKEAGDLYGMRILRPFLSFSKKEIGDALARFSSSAFEDSSNSDNRYLRVRLRREIFSGISDTFGKRIEPALIRIAEEAEELDCYFEEKTRPILDSAIEGPFGVYLDLKNAFPLHLLEIKYLLRLFCKNKEAFFSRTIIEQAAAALLAGESHRHYRTGLQRLGVDRHRFFWTNRENDPDPPRLKIVEGTFTWNRWRVEIRKGTYRPSFFFSTWKEGMRGFLSASIPEGEFYLSMSNRGAVRKLMKKNRVESKAPPELYDFFPVVCDRAGVYREFISEKNFSPLKEGEDCLEIHLNLIE